MDEGFPTVQYCQLLDLGSVDKKGFLKASFNNRQIFLIDKLAAGILPFLTIR